MKILKLSENLKNSLKIKKGVDRYAFWRYN